jgi:hypothetical protein
VRKYTLALRALIMAVMLANAAVGQQTSPPLAPGAVSAGKGNPYQRARQLSARLVSFTAQPASVRPGEPVVLEWLAENPTSVAIEPGVGRVTARGSRQLFPSATTKYTLTVKGVESQVLTRELTVTVSGAPISSAAKPTTQNVPNFSGVYDFASFGPAGSAPNAAAGPVLKQGAEKFKVVRGPSDAGLTADCMPLAPPQAFSVPYQFQIIQSASTVAIFHEYPGTFRIIPTDGRPHQKDVDPTWMGDSVGRWEGDALVIDTIGFNDKTEISGYRHTENLHLLERLARGADGSLQYEATIEDPSVFEKPWKITRVFPPRTDLTKIGEFVCENNKDYSGLFGKKP